MKERPDYWAWWTKYVPLWFMLIVCISFLPIYILWHVIIAIRNGVENWWEEVQDVWRVFRGR